MTRYKFLKKDEVYSALNRLRAALLAAKDGNDVEYIIKAVLTQDERLKIGRRIEIAELLSAGMIHEEIADELKVGRTTIAQVSSRMNNYPQGFKLINKRLEKVEKDFNNLAYRSGGGPKLVFKKKMYTGLKRKDIKRK